MPHVVTQPCLNYKYTKCAVVCPVECFYQDDQMVYIDPEDCIDCEVCVIECPVGAIYPEYQVPEQWLYAINLNADRAAELKRDPLAHLTEQQEPLEGPDCVRADVIFADTDATEYVVQNVRDLTGNQIFDTYLPLSQRSGLVSRRCNSCASTRRFPARCLPLRLVP